MLSKYKQEVVNVFIKLGAAGITPDDINSVLNADLFDLNDHLKEKKLTYLDLSAIILHNADNESITDDDLFSDISNNIMS